MRLQAASASLRGRTDISPQLPKQGLVLSSAVPICTQLMLCSSSIFCRSWTNTRKVSGWKLCSPVFTFCLSPSTLWYWKLPTNAAVIICSKISLNGPLGSIFGKFPLVGGSLKKSIIYNVSKTKMEMIVGYYRIYIQAWFSWGLHSFTGL